MIDGWLNFELLSPHVIERCSKMTVMSICCLLEHCGDCCAQKAHNSKDLMSKLGPEYLFVYLHLLLIKWC